VAGSVHRASYGFDATLDGRVLDVTPGSAAADAGLAAGDRIDIARTPVDARLPAATPLDVDTSYGV
jgi:hypothetical protein